ncbi:MAG: lysylphosphatidylglycerol synthase transmembrane domain-containing protein [Bacteroidales bacterium]|jgi:uncharacterized membrane protein YbhN (UPF0104 family)|nr:lysylphosphatidylglycerol synthase transmembrane domain-containing protein [Bacteroidales bacterium]
MNNLSGRLLSALKYVVLLSLAGVLLWLSFREVKWDSFVSGVKDADWRWIGLSMVISVLAFLIRALRWRLIMLPLGKPVSRMDSWHGINVGYITNFALPRAGELARCGVISKKTGLPFETVAGTVVLERSIDMLSLFLVSAGVMVFFWDSFGGFIDKQILSSLENKLSTELIITGVVILLASAMFLYMIWRYRKSHPIFAKIVNIVKGILDGLVSGFKMPQKWTFIIYTILLWVCYWAMSYTTILAFDNLKAGLGADDALFLMMVGSFGWVIPVQGGIGAYHLIISLALLSVYGISQTTGVVFATISHGSQTITMLIFGALSLLKITLKK